MSIALLLSSPPPPPPLLRLSARNPTFASLSPPPPSPLTSGGGARSRTWLQLASPRFPRPRPLAPVRASSGGGGAAARTGIAAASAATVLLAVMNRVLYKLALVPLKEYPFFLAQVTTFGYATWAIHSDIVSVFFAVASGAKGGQFLSEVELIWPALMVLSSAFQAGASIIKELVFIDGARRLQGKRPDIFVVNSFGSGFQALFVFLLLPFLSNLRGIPFAELPAYLKRGAACFLNVGGNLRGCHGAPLLPLLFITTNMAFNISALNLVKMSTALVASLTATLAVPISIYVLSLPLPYIAEGTTLSKSFVIGAVILVLGLVLYNLPRSPDQFKAAD